MCEMLVVGVGEEGGADCLGCGKSLRVELGAENMKQIASGLRCYLFNQLWLLERRRSTICDSRTEIVKRAGSE